MYHFQSSIKIISVFDNIIICIMCIINHNTLAPGDGHIHVVPWLTPLDFPQLLWIMALSSTNLSAFYFSFMIYWIHQFYHHRFYNFVHNIKLEFNYKPQKLEATSYDKMEGNTFQFCALPFLNIQLLIIQIYYCDIYNIYQY